MLATTFQHTLLFLIFEVSVREVNAFIFPPTVSCHYITVMNFFFMKSLKNLKGRNHLDPYIRLFLYSFYFCRKYACEKQLFGLSSTKKNSYLYFFCKGPSVNICPVENIDCNGRSFYLSCS